MEEKANSSRSILEKNIGLIRSMLGVWSKKSKKCCLDSFWSFDLLFAIWDSVDMGKELLSECVPFHWKILMNPPLLFRNDTMQLDDSSDEEENADD